MTNDLALYDPNFANGAMSLAKQLSTSALLPRALQGKPADVLIVLLTGRELGIGPMQAIRGINVIDGKGVTSADLMVALAISKRDVCEYFRLLESSPQKATYETKRVGSEPVKLTWTIQQAQTARLTGKQNWQTYPDAMLRARCAAALARAVYPDLFLGVYTPEEAESFANGNGHQPERDVTPANGHGKNGRTTVLKEKLAARLAQPAPAPVEAEAVEPPPPGDADAPPPPDDAQWEAPPEPPADDIAAEHAQAVAERETEQRSVIWPMGKNKGRPISDFDAKELYGAAKYLEERLEKDPSGKYADESRTLLAAVKAEQGRRK